MRATTAFIKLFVRGLAWDAEASSITFEAALKVAAQAKLTESKRGKVLTGTGQGGATVEYTLPPLGDMTAQDLAEVCSLLLDRVDALKAATPGITDDALKAALLAGLRPCREFRPDFSNGGLRAA